MYSQFSVPSDDPSVTTQGRSVFGFSERSGGKSLPFEKNLQFLSKIHPTSFAAGTASSGTIDRTMCCDGVGILIGTIRSNRIKSGPDVTLVMIRASTSTSSRGKFSPCLMNSAIFKIILQSIPPLGALTPLPRSIDEGIVRGTRDARGNCVESICKNVRIRSEM